MVPNEPKDHHYVPQFYLEKFSIEGSDPPKFWVHSANRESRQSKPKNEAFQRELHTIYPVGSPPDRSLEKDFSKIEGIHAAVLKEILEKGGAQSLTKQERQTFAEYVGLQIVRTPPFMKLRKAITKSFNDALENAIDGDSTNLDRITKDTGSKTKEVLEKSGSEKAKEWLNNEIMQVHSHLFGIGGIAVKHAEILLNEFSWWFPSASSSIEYCTSDDPVIVLSKEGNRLHEGIARDVSIFFPLSPNLCFFADRDMGAIPPSVESINQQMVWQAHRFIYSRSETPGIDTDLAERRKIEAIRPRDAAFQDLIDINTIRKFIN